MSQVTGATLNYSPSGQGSPPTIVVVVRVLLGIGMVLLGLALVGGILGTALGSAALSTKSLIGGVGLAAIMGVVLVICAAFFVLYLWLFIAMGKGATAAWYVQLVLSVLGLLNLLATFAHHGSTLGGLISFVLSAIILYFWVKPETKAWFRIG